MSDREVTTNSTRKRAMSFVILSGTMLCLGRDRYCLTSGDGCTGSSMSCMGRISGLQEGKTPLGGSGLSAGLSSGGSNLGHIFYPGNPLRVDSGLTDDIHHSESERSAFQL